jgi:hypothetical protein
MYAMSNCSLKTVIPFTVMMALAELWLEGFISVSEVTLRDGNGCVNI